MNNLSVRFLWLILILQLPAIASAQNADAVIEKHLTALGGRDALGKLSSRKSTGTVTLSTAGGPISGTVETVMKTPNKSHVLMKLDLSAMGAGTMTVEQGFDGTAGFSVNSIQGETQISAKQNDNLRNSVFPTPFLAYKDRGTRVDVLPTEKVGGKDAIVLLVTPKTGSPTRMFLDAETYLLIRLITTVNSAQLGGDIEQTTDLSDYRAVDDVKVPFRLVTANAVQTVNITLDKVEHNVAIDDAAFAKK
jgi:hypothetical protein